MRILIVEDEKATLAELVSVVKSITKDEVVSYHDPVSVLEDIKNIKVDAAFLDISMPVYDGLYLAHKLLEANPHLPIVFITSFNNYAAEAFEIQAMDYILKPIDPKRIKLCITKIARKLDKPVLKITGDVKIKLFGHMEVKNGYRNVHFRRNKSKEILAHLVLHDFFSSRDQLIDDLYSDLEMKKAIIHLQTQIYQLRKDLRPLKDYIHIVTTEDGYQLELNNVEIDYKKFITYPTQTCTLENCEDMIHIYSKGLLTNMSNEWVIRYYISAEDRIIECYRKYVELLEEEKQFEKLKTAIFDFKPFLVDMDSIEHYNNILKKYYVKNVSEKYLIAK